MMISPEILEADLHRSLGQLASQPLPEVLLQKGILRQLATDQVRQRLCESIQFSAEEQALVIHRLFEGFTGIIPPSSLGPGWLESMPSMAQGPLRERWGQIRLQKWMEETYRDRLEPYFLERREDLEQVVYGMIRLRHQGAAEELYLRLVDDEADFGDLAREHSLGDERFTRGLVGPMRISQPHPTIRAVLQKLAIGDLHPPFHVDNWVLLLRMEHRQPARLNDETMLQLCEELLQRDLDALLDQQLETLYPILVKAFPGRSHPERSDQPDGPAPSTPATATGMAGKTAVSLPSPAKGAPAVPAPPDAVQAEPVRAADSVGNPSVGGA